MKFFLIVFGAFGVPALLYVAISGLELGAVRELAPWALMLSGAGGFSVALRARQAPPDMARDSMAARWTRSS